MEQCFTVESNIEDIEYDDLKERAKKLSKESLVHLVYLLADQQKIKLLVSMSNYRLHKYGMCGPDAGGCHVCHWALEVLGVIKFH